jgi:thiamine biosynthesis protein ThiS
MKIFIERPEKNLEIEFEGNAAELLEKIGINSEEVILSRNGEIITLDQNLKNEDEIKVLSVVSGG